MPTLPAASMPPDDADHAETVNHALTQPRPNFWQQDWVQNLLPLITSVVLHVSIVVLAVVLIKELPVALRQVTQEQVLIPDASFAEGNTPGGIPNPGLGNDPMRQARQDNIANVPPNSEGWADKPSQTLAQTMMSGGLGETPSEISVIGPGAGTGSGKSSGIGQGSGAGPGTGDGSGALAPFGPGGGGGGVGPKFMKVGLGGNVRSIIFVCDASGSMMNKMATL